MPQTPKKPSSLEAAAPKIPGVPQSRPKAKPAGEADTSPAWMRQPPYIWAAAGATVLLFILAIVWWAHGSAGSAQSALAGVTSPPDSKVAPAATRESFPTGPGKVATTEELAQEWAAKKFYFRSAGQKSTLAIVVHLPGNTYWAFSLREPYGSCELELISDLDKLRTEYNFTATHPMVGDPCSHTVFDLATYGPGPNGLVRGAIVAGPGVRPPYAIELQVKGSDIIASRSE